MVERHMPELVKRERAARKPYPELRPRHVLHDLAIGRSMMTEATYWRHLRVESPILRRVLPVQNVLHKRRYGVTGAVPYWAYANAAAASVVLDTRWWRDICRNS